METTPYLTIPSEATLVIYEGDNFRNCSLDTKDKWTIGRICPGNSPDIPLDSVIAGRKQGEFICVDEEWFFCDKGSVNGTYFNGKKIEKGINGNTKPVMLSNGDILRIDSNNLDAPDDRGVWIMFTTEPIGSEWKEFILNKKDCIIGRNDECDIVIDLPYISSKHLKISYLNNKYYVTDCNSLSGSWVNNNKIDNSYILREKDKISICDCCFVFTGNGLIYSVYSTESAKNNRENLVLNANIISKKVPDNSGHGKKELIRNVKIKVKNGSLVALLGSSGAGKTTVMNCLNGMDVIGVDGSVKFKGEDLFKNFDRLKFLIGSVPQQEVFHPMLSIEEELREAAIMRLPNDTTKKEIKTHVDRAIEQLGLEAVRKNSIGKCSGGEKRRVNIAIELVADRQLLCLDEPDAGLDPKTKRELFTILHKLAHEEGKSILVIIHDVSEIDLFDQIIMMTKVDNIGRLAFSGTPEEAREKFSVDIKDIYDVLAKKPEKYIEG